MPPKNSPVPLTHHNPVDAQEVSRPQHSPQVHGVLYPLQSQPEELGPLMGSPLSLMGEPFLPADRMKGCGLQANALVDPSLAKDIQHLPWNQLHRDPSSLCSLGEFLHHRPGAGTARLEEQLEEFPLGPCHRQGAGRNPKQDLRAFSPFNRQRSGP